MGREDNQSSARAVTLTCRYAFVGLGLLLLADCRLFDHRPDVPSAPVGPAYGLPDSSYAFLTSATDPDGDSVQLQMSWGEMPVSDWSDRAAGGAMTSSYRIWRHPGDYEVRVRARDTRGAVSDWSPALEVLIINPDSLPLAPSTPFGPDSTRVGFINDFACVVRGPPGESLSLSFDWGDGGTSYPWVASGFRGETLRVQQAYWYPGSYFVRAQACDIHRVTSSRWSGQHKIKVANPSGSGWVRNYPAGLEYSDAHSVAPTADGGLVITGESDSGLFLAKTDATGDLSWMRVYDTLVAPIGMSVMQVADEGYIIASTGLGPWFDSGADLVRTDKNGDLLWQRVYWDPAGGEEPGMYARSFRRCTDGGYIIAASTVLMKTDSLGDSVWARAMSAEDVEPLTDGGYIVCGYHDGASLTRTDASGNLQWERVYGGSRHMASAVSVTPDGGYVLTGQAWSETCDDSVYVARTTGDGDLVWERTCHGPYGVDGLDVGLSGNGDVLVTGMTYSCTSPYLARFDAVGNSRWQRMLCEDWGTAWSVLPTADNGCVVAGSNEDGYATLFKVDQDGGMGQEFGSASPRIAPRVGHGLARMRLRKSGLGEETR